jgi:SAM-dependent methyltransferase
VYGDREGLRATFDRAAGIYQEARPEYPDELYEALLELAELQPSDRLLEIGCATGKATLPLARLGFDITCIELGANLAAAARQNLTEFADVRVVQEPFEKWTPGVETKFDLVFAATAWKWLDPVVRYRKARSLLTDGGHLAFWSAEHVFPEGGDAFFREIQDVYEEIGEGPPADYQWLRPDELPSAAAEVEASGLFESCVVRRFDWEVTHDADGYIDLLNTFSGNIAMEQWQRDRLYGEIRRRLALRPDGCLRRHWGCVLHVARRRDQSL